MSFGGCSSPWGDLDSLSSHGHSDGLWRTFSEEWDEPEPVYRSVGLEIAFAHEMDVLQTEDPQNPAEDWGLLCSAPGSQHLLREGERLVAEANANAEAAAEEHRREQQRHRFREMIRKESERPAGHSSEEEIMDIKKELKQLISQGEDIDAEDRYGQSALLLVSATHLHQCHVLRASCKTRQQPDLVVAWWFVDCYSIYNALSRVGHSHDA